jgi:ureidoglycolate hydrolase
MREEIMDIKAKKISPDNFKKYGQLIQVPASEVPTIKTDEVTFWQRQADWIVPGLTEIGVLKVKMHAMLFNQLENHFDTPTLLVSLDGGYIIPVAPPSDDTPGADQVEAFEVEPGQAVVLHSKCWHWATYPIDKAEITLLVFFKEKTLDLDTVIEELDETCTVIR